MNSTPEAAESPEQSEPVSKPKKQISAQRRILSWVFIAALLVIVFFEWQAKSSQANTVQGLETAMEEVGDVGEIPLAQFQTLKKGSSSEEIDESGAILKKIHYRWNGVFKTYDLRLLVDEGDMVIAFDEQAEGETIGGIKPISKKNLEKFIQNSKTGNEPKTEEKQTDPKADASGETSEK